MKDDWWGQVSKFIASSLWHCAAEMTQCNQYSNKTLYCTSKQDCFIGILDQFLYTQL